MSFTTPPPYSSQLPPMGPPAAAGGPAQEKRGKRGKRGKDGAPTQRVITRQKVIALLFAVIVAGGLGYEQLAAKAPSLYVAEVTHDVQPLAQVTEADLTAVPITQAYAEKGAITGSSAQAVKDAALKVTSNSYAQYLLHQGQQLHADDFSSNASLLATPLGPDERLISISGNVASSVAGTIHPGDHVDVIAVATSGSQMSGVIASDVPVVSVTAGEDQYNNAASQQAGASKDKKASDLLPSDPIPGIYVLRVKASQMTALTVADATGKVYLAYRGQNATTTPNTPATVQQAICQGAPATAGC